MKILNRTFFSVAAAAFFFPAVPGVHADGHSTNQAHACCTKPLSAAKFSTKSLYQLDATWANDRGEQVKLASFKGRPQIVTMFFSSCVTACPLLVHDMSQIAEALPEDVRKATEFILISFDSERDTPEALAACRKQHNLPENWTLLHGTPDDILETAALLGVKFRKEENGGFAHSNVITLLNGGGEIVTQQVGLNRDSTELRQAVVNLVHP